MLKIIVKQLLPVFILLFLFFYLLNINGIISDDFFAAFQPAALLNFANVFIALLLFHFSKEKSASTFMIFNIGGMGLRMFFMLGTIIIFIKMLKIDLTGFILIFFIFYFILLGVEINQFRKKVVNQL